jgi:hypothetical protein
VNWVKYEACRTPGNPDYRFPEREKRTLAVENGTVVFLTKPFDERLTTAIKLRLFMGTAH